MIFQQIILILVFSIIGSSNDGILVLDQEILTEAKAQFPFIVVYFSSFQCDFCAQLDTTFAIVSEKFAKEHKDIAKFGKMVMENQNEAAFQSYGVSAVPEIRIIKDGKMQEETYDWLTYDETSVEVLNKWIQNMILGIKKAEYSKDISCENCEKIIYNCESQFSKNIFSLSLTYLQFNFECASQIEKNRIIMWKEGNQKQIVCENWNQCLKDIKNMKNQGTQNWNHQHIYELFNRNQSLFVLITNNDEDSDKTIVEYEGIKKNWDQKDQENVLPLFTIASIYENVQEVAKLKSYIGGYESYGYPYPFPILAFLKNVDGEIHKYLYQNRYYKSEKSKYSIEEWMNRVLEGKEKRHIKGNIPNEQAKSPYQREEEDLKGKIFRSSYLALEDAKANKTIPLVVIYSWKHSFQLQQFAKKVKELWGTLKNYHEMFEVHAINLLYDDPPAGIFFDSIPSIILYDKERNVYKYEGITDLQTVKHKLEQFVRTMNI